VRATADEKTHLLACILTANLVRPHAGGEKARRSPLAPRPPPPSRYIRCRPSHGARMRAFQNLERRGFPGSASANVLRGAAGGQRRCLLSSYIARIALRSSCPPRGTDLRPFPFRADPPTGFGWPLPMCLAGKVHGLERFAHINTLGCIKISKKHDKHSSIPLKQVGALINQLIKSIKTQRVLYPIEIFCRSS